MQPSSPFVNAAQPLPVPVAPPPTIPDDLHYAGVEDDAAFDALADRRARRRALFARLLGVLGILVTLGFAAVTVGRAWLGSLPSLVWPSKLERPEVPVLPGPLGPRNEPVLPAPSVEPPPVPPSEAAPPAAVESRESAQPEASSPERVMSVPPTTEPTASQPQPLRPRTDPARRAAPLPAEPTLPPERAPSRPSPEDQPAAPTVDPSSPQAPPAGEASPHDAPRVPADEGNTIFGED